MTGVRFSGMCWLGFYASLVTGCAVQVAIGLPAQDQQPLVTARLGEPSRQETGSRATTADEREPRRIAVRFKPLRSEPLQPATIFRTTIGATEHAASRPLPPKPVSGASSLAPTPKQHSSSATSLTRVVAHHDPSEQRAAATPNVVPAPPAESLSQPRQLDVTAPHSLATPQQESPELQPVAPASQVTEHATTQQHHPIDLPTVLRLAGANNWSIQLAMERVTAAQAQLDAAEALWLPTLNAGLGYTKHEGMIQATDGTVLDVSRNALFVGGGAKLANAPLAAGAGGPARLQVDLSVADAIFKPLAARRVLSAQKWRQWATFNDTLMQSPLAYFDLVESQARLELSREAVDDAQSLLKLTQGFVTAGKGAESDVSRVRVEIANRRRMVVQAELSVRIASTELVRVLQLEATTSLRSAEEKPVLIELVADDTSLETMTTQAVAGRPEILEHEWLLEAARERARAETLRPYIPNLHLGASAGGFGGGRNGDLDQLDGRADFDVLAVWEVRNLGLGNRAMRAGRESELRRAMLKLSQLTDRVKSEVTKAHHEVSARRRQLEIARESVRQAQEAHLRNLARIQGLEGLPLESLQSLLALEQTRLSLLSTIIDYNRGQARLLRSIGREPAAESPPAPSQTQPGS
ncbi:MAG: TolC family protein [Planctomycetaceae bacterium]